MSESNVKSDDKIIAQLEKGITGYELEKIEGTGIGPNKSSAESLLLLGVDIGGGGDACMTLEGKLKGAEEILRVVGTEGNNSRRGSGVGIEVGGGEGEAHLESSEEEIESAVDSERKENMDMSEFFKKTVSKKKNVYSNDPVPLNTPWTFWVDRNQRGVSAEVFEANLKRIYTVYTVQRFWNVYVNLPKPSTLNVRSSLHMMRDERKPMWEESYNQKGGSFRVRIQKRDTDKVWKEVLMAAIGEQFTEFVSMNDEICGVSISIREREDMLIIWNTNAGECGTARVFTCLRMLLPDTTFTQDHYKPHITHQAFEKKKLVGKEQQQDANLSCSDTSILENSSASEDRESFGEEE